MKKQRAVASIVFGHALFLLRLVLLCLLLSSLLFRVKPNYLPRRSPLLDEDSPDFDADFHIDYAEEPCWDDYAQPTDSLGRPMTRQVTYLSLEGEPLDSLLSYIPDEFSKRSYPSINSFLHNESHQHPGFDFEALKRLHHHYLLLKESSLGDDYLENQLQQILSLIPKNQPYFNGVLSFYLGEMYQVARRKKNLEEASSYLKRSIILGQDDIYKYLPALLETTNKEEIPSLLFAGAINHLEILTKTPLARPEKFQMILDNGIDGNSLFDILTSTSRDNAQANQVYAFPDQWEDDPLLVAVVHTISFINWQADFFGGQNYIFELSYRGSSVFDYYITLFSFLNSFDEQKVTLSLFKHLIDNTPPIRRPEILNTSFLVNTTQFSNNFLHYYNDHNYKKGQPFHHSLLPWLSDTFILELKLIINGWLPYSVDLISIDANFFANFYSAAIPLAFTLIFNAPKNISFRYRQALTISPNQAHSEDFSQIAPPIFSSLKWLTVSYSTELKLLTLKIIELSPGKIQTSALFPTVDHNNAKIDTNEVSSISYDPETLLRLKNLSKKNLSTIESQLTIEENIFHYQFDVPPTIPALHKLKNYFKNLGELILTNSAEFKIYQCKQIISGLKKKLADELNDFENYLQTNIQGIDQASISQLIDEAKTYTLLDHLVQGLQNAEANISSTFDDASIQIDPWKTQLNHQSFAAKTNNKTSVEDDIANYDRQLSQLQNLQTQISAQKSAIQGFIKGLSKSVDKLKIRLAHERKKIDAEPSSKQNSHKHKPEKHKDTPKAKAAIRVEVMPNVNLPKPKIKAKPATPSQPHKITFFERPKKLAQHYALTYLESISELANIQLMPDEAFSIQIKYALLNAFFRFFEALKKAPSAHITPEANETIVNLRNSFMHKHKFLTLDVLIKFAKDLYTLTPQNNKPGEMLSILQGICNDRQSLWPDFNQCLINLKKTPFYQEYVKNSDPDNHFKELIDTITYLLDNLEKLLRITNPSTTITGAMEAVLLCLGECVQMLQNSHYFTLRILKMFVQDPSLFALLQLCKNWRDEVAHNLSPRSNPHQKFEKELNSLKNYQDELQIYGHVADNIHKYLFTQCDNSAHTTSQKILSQLISKEHLDSLTTFKYQISQANRLADNKVNALLSSTLVQIVPSITKRLSLINDYPLGSSSP